MIATRATTRRVLVPGLLIVIAVIAAVGAHRPAASHSTDRSASPAATGLDPDLREALRRAAADAAGDGIQLVVDSGRRSPQHQERLLRDAIATYGSAEEAARWVATPETSAHVQGDAIDLGPAGAAAWLSGHGAAYGLCPVYDNEPWHYELRPRAPAHGCPPTYADPTHDPRMHR